IRNEAPHGFSLCMTCGNIIALKGILLLVAITYHYSIKLIIFSTHKKPIEITPNTTCHMVALCHQDSILSIGAWYLLGLAKNWIKRTASACMTSYRSNDFSAYNSKISGCSP